MNSNTAFHQFLTEWAEDEFWAGHLLAKKIYEYGPDLEENIAIGSIAQDEIGHCRMLLGLLTSSEKEMDDLIYGKEPGELRVSRLAAYWHDYDWAVLTTKQLIYDTADRVRLNFCKNISDADFRHASEMMNREENIHLEHWMAWAALMADDDKGAKKMQQAVDRIYPLLPDFFSSPLYERLAAEFSLSPNSPQSLLKQTLDNLNPSLQKLGLTIPCSEQAMIGQLSVKGGRYGLHDPELIGFYQEYTSVYRKNPEMIWG